MQNSIGLVFHSGRPPQMIWVDTAFLTTPATVGNLLVGGRRWRTIAQYTNRPMRLHHPAFPL